MILLDLHHVMAAAEATITFLSDRTKINRCSVIRGNMSIATGSEDAIVLIAPVAIIFVAENLGHVKAIGAMTGWSLDGFLGRAFLGDSFATIVSARGGGTGVTTYAENIGVMAATKVYSTLLIGGSAPQPLAPSSCTRS